MRWRKTGSLRMKFSKIDSIEEFVLEKGWYIPQIHEKYMLDQSVKNQ